MSPLMLLRDNNWHKILLYNDNKQAHQQQPEIRFQSSTTIALPTSLSDSLKNLTITECFRVSNFQSKRKLVPFKLVPEANDRSDDVTFTSPETCALTFRTSAEQKLNQALQFHTIMKKENKD